MTDRALRRGKASYRWADHVPFELPNAPYGTLLVDPPWEVAGSWGFNPANGFRTPYSVMPDEEVIGMRVYSISAPDSLLLLWTINSTLPLAVAVAERWGFEYKTVLTWDKVRSGIGVWLKGQTEHLLIATRGHILPPTLSKRGTRWTTLVREARTAHSRKPDIIYAIAEDLGPAPRVELFARRLREGWDSWGDEVPGIASGEIMA